MPRTQPALEDVRRPAPRGLGLKGRRLDTRQFLVTAEHASNHIPSQYKGLGLTGGQLQAHIAWDPGAKAIARATARTLGCPCHEGSHSRLLIDLNRSPHHRKLIARESFSIPIPGNASVSRDERDRRIRLYYTPFREAVLADVRRIIRAHGQCVHISMHSFTPVVDGVNRKGDFGILYDPSRRLESALAANLIDLMASEGFHARRNYPYRGTNDGHTTGLRALFPASRYVGLEVEVNQRILQTGSEIRHVATKIAAAVGLVAGAK
ncbi:MAG: N-formylglutamate amidohydrolase [Bryobacterales bacterium]